MDLSSRKLNRRSRVLLLFAGLLLSGSVLAEATLSQASWDANRKLSNTLYVKGTANNGSDVSVTITNPDTVPNKLLGIVGAVRGKFQLLKQDLTSVPCRVQASDGSGAPSIMDVANAPADCEGGAPNTPPVVTIGKPADGTTVNEGTSVAFEGAASDAEDDDATLTDKLAWALDGSALPDTGASGSFSTSGLSAGIHTLSASVTDSNGAPGEDSISFFVIVDAPNSPPTVTILGPADGTHYTEGDPVTFSGSASDAEDGDRTTLLSWSVDGSSVGSGGGSGSFSTTGLSTGPHPLAASVTDSRGAPGSAWISIFVDPANQSPVVTISSPGNGISFAPGDTVTFSGSASDAEDGDVTGSLSWFSSIDGEIGGDTGFSRSDLSVGVHTITASATDDDGATGSLSRSIAIRTPDVGDTGGPPGNAFNIMMNYELGMHCTGFEFAYCCVLPPYNSILAQVVKTEKSGGYPQLLEADPSIVDGLGRPYVVRDPALDGSGRFKKYVLRYWHDAQPRDPGEPGAPQSDPLISLVEGNSLVMWNTVFDAAATGADGQLVYGDYNGSRNVLQGDGDTSDANDNYWNGVWNHLYIYEDLEGSGGHPGGVALESDKVRLGVHVVYPENTGAALQPMGPGVNVDLDGNGTNDVHNVLTFSGDSGTNVFTQMKVLEDLPVMLTSPRIWEALGLPLTPFEDTIDFFTDPGAVDETSLRPYVEMKAQMHYYDPAVPGGIGAPVLDGGQPVIGMGTAPIDIPNCERCHSLAEYASVNSAQNGHPAVDTLVQAEIDFWTDELGIGPGDSDWYPRLKGAAISILAIHDDEHGTSFTADFDPDSTDGNASTRLGHETVVCQRCHADNVIAVVKSADCGPGQHCDVNDPRNQLYSEIKPASMLIPPLTEAIHLNHKDNLFDDSLGRSGSCQGCHPAHRSDGDMSNYPITEAGLNAFAGSDNRDAAGGCFVGRDVHSNPFRNDEATTQSHMNPVGQWLVDNVVSDTGADKGIWCTNCHTQLSQELWKAENVDSLVHAQPGDPGHVREPSMGADLEDVATAIGISLTQAEAWLDPKTTPDTSAIWNSDPGMCAHAASLLGLAPASPFQDGNVATIEIAIGSTDGSDCSTHIGLPGPDCFGTGEPSFYICGTVDGDPGGAIPGVGDVNVALLDFCTTPECVAAAQAKVTTATGGGCDPLHGGGGNCAVPVPFSAATDGRDHWLSAGEPHCADCHSAPYVEQSGNVNAFPPFNYPQKASLFRYSRGHQDITCQGCHESTHGLYPVTPPGYVAGSTKAVDQTTWDQAAGLNTDGSHGPLKCGACHDSNTSGVWSDADRITYEGVPIRDDFDAAVSWMHTYTDEADPRDQFCRNCHGNKTGEMQEDDGRWKDGWMVHAMRGRVSRNTMDKAEIAQFGHVAGDPAFEDPRTSACRGCHDDEWSEVSCTGSESGQWKRHLTEGRVSAGVWEYVSLQRTGTTCGW